jgi:hypothetical protein
MRLHADLSRGVLEALEHAREAHRVLNAGDRQADQDDDASEHPSTSEHPSRTSVAAVLVEPLPEKNSDSRMIAPKSAIEAAAITSWPKLLLIFPRVLQDRDDRS